MVIDFRVSPFLLLSESLMILPNSSNCCVVCQDHIGQVRNQKRLQKNSHLARVIRWLPVSRLGFGTRGNKSLMRNVSTAMTAR